MPFGVEGRGIMSREMSSWSATLSDEVMAAARRAFERHDHDNSGTIQVEVSVWECGRTGAGHCVPAPAILNPQVHARCSLQEICTALLEARRDASEAQVLRAFCTVLLRP